MLARALPKFRILLVLITLVGLLGLPLNAFAAKGTNVDFDVTAQITRVSPGHEVPFEAYLENVGPGTITKVQFHASFPGGTFVSVSDPGRCTGGGSVLTCELGNIAAGAPRIALGFVFSAPDDIADVAQIDFVGTFSGDAARDRTGTKRDSWVTEISIEVNASDDFLGRWQPAHGTTLAPITVGNSAHQTTTVVIPPVDFDYATLIEQLDAPVACDDSVIEGIGRRVDLEIANGEELGSPLAITILIHPDEAGGKVPSQVNLVHRTDAGDCVPVPLDCKKFPGFCYDASWLRQDGVRFIQIQAQLPHNGSIKGW